MSARPELQNESSSARPRRHPARPPEHQLFSHSRREDYWRSPRGSCPGVGVARSPTGPLRPCRDRLAVARPVSGSRATRSPVPPARPSALSQGVMKSCVAILPYAPALITPIPIRVNSGRRMFSLWPGESMSARCATDIDWAYARFSPALVYVTPAAFNLSKGEPETGDSWLKYLSLNISSE